MWRQCACDIDYAKRNDTQVGILACARGREDAPAGETHAQIREWLWKGDFATFVGDAISAPGCDAIAQPFQESWERMQRMGLSTRNCVSMAVFLNTTNPYNIANEELRWTVYLFASGRSIGGVASMSCDTLASEYVRVKSLKPWPAMCEQISWTSKDGSIVEVQIDELDVASRSLKLLLAMCEHKNKNRRISATDQKAAGPAPMMRRGH
jgi:hypothetical protein